MLCPFSCSSDLHFPIPWSTVLLLLSLSVACLSCLPCSFLFCFLSFVSLFPPRLLPSLVSSCLFVSCLLSPLFLFSLLSILTSLFNHHYSLPPPQQPLTPTPGSCISLLTDSTAILPLRRRLPPLPLPPRLFHQPNNIDAPRLASAFTSSRVTRTTPPASPIAHCTTATMSTDEELDRNWKPSGRRPQSYVRPI